MQTPHSPLRAPPLNASNMGSGPPQRQGSNGGPVMPQPPTPGSGPVFISPRGTPKTRDELRKFIAQLTAAEHEGKHIPSGLRHEVMWMVQQHYPEHRMLGGQQIPPPPSTLPELLHLGQRNGPPAQRRPQASSPNMIPSGTPRPASHGAQRSHGMTINPGLATSSTSRPRNPMPAMQILPSSGVPSQGLAPFSPTATSSARSPAQVPTPAMSRTPSAISFTPGSPAAFVFQNDQAIRSPSKASPYHTGQAQYSPPLTPRRPSFTSATAGARLPPQQTPAPPQNGYTTGSVPSRGMFAAPPSRPVSARASSGQGRSSAQFNYRSPDVKAMIDAHLAQALKMHPPNSTAKYIEWMGNDYERKAQFVQTTRQRYRLMQEEKAQASTAPGAAPQVNSRNMVTGPAGNKRKQPHTAVEQPKSKRPAIDLTIDDPPSVSPPSASIKNPPIPTHLIPTPSNADACEHALEHGIYMPDLNLRLYSKEEIKVARMVHRGFIHKARSDLDPVPENLKALVKSVKKMATEVAVPAAETATANEDVRSNEVGHNSDRAASRTKSPLVEQSPTVAEYGVGEERSSRSPDVFTENISEQRANLEYELSSFERDGIHV